MRTKESKKPEDLSYLLRKWTKAEKDSVLLLFSNGLKPKAISEKTGYPMGQIKFWVYGIRKNKKNDISRRDKIKHAGNSLRHYYRQKETDWISWKSQCLRSMCIKLGKKHNQSPPSKEDLRIWLEGLKFKCFYCGINTDLKSIHIDHRLPLSRGGSIGLDNITECCKKCNLIKGSLTDHEFRQLMLLISSFDDGGASVKARLRRGFIGRRT